jgi:hypothetical protein
MRYPLLVQAALATAVLAAAAACSSSPSTTASSHTGGTASSSPSIGASASPSSPADSGTTPTPGSSSSESKSLARSDAAQALLADCAISRRIASVYSSAQQVNAELSGSQRFVSGGKLVLSSQNYNDFEGWYQGHAGGAVVGGKTLSDWQQWVVANDALPSSVCGTTSSPGQLYDQVYAGWSSMRTDNPWAG